MPWVPELFSEPALERVLEERQRELMAVPYFDGLMAGEPDALVKSFVAVPELHDPMRGRVKGARAFAAFVAEASSWLRSRHAAVEEVEHVIVEGHGFEEVILHLDAHDGRVALPVAIVADLSIDGHIEELRIYFSSWPLVGRYAGRPPVLQPDPQLHGSDVVGEYQRALAAGNLNAIVATFEADGYAREPTGGLSVHRGRDALRSFYERLFAESGGIPLEHCAAIDDGRACALEHNVVRWGETELPPQAGLTVYVRGPGGMLAAARSYHDVDPPLFG